MKDDVKDLGPDRVTILSEDDIADCFAKQYREELRYVAKWGKWFNYDGMYWREEQTLKVFDLVRTLCRELTWESNSKDAEIKRVRSAKTVAAVVQLARADRRMAATFDQWDVDLMLLNTPDGVVDLKTGNVRSHRPEDYMTKITAVGPGGQCPQWKKFLDRFTKGDQDLEDHLQRMCGYCLTGDISEQIFFFMHGPGGNGKGVFLHTVSRLMASYAKVAPMEVFIATNMERHLTELAMLQGARLVTASEMEEGKRWDEARLKELTGSDEITARFMRQDHFTFMPQLKLVISGNHRPGLRTVDEAIKRRTNVIKCDAVIPKSERDLKLEKKLEAEWGGILQWMIDGCIKWQRDGLKPSASVIDATNEYLTVEDVFGGWLEECCVIGKDKFDETSRLWDAWQRWATGSGEFVGTQKLLAKRLEERGFTADRATINGKQQRVYRGLAVIM
jgi:putative DNA primase/helicase